MPSFIPATSPAIGSFTPALSTPIGALEGIVDYGPVKNSTYDDLGGTYDDLEYFYDGLIIVFDTAVVATPGAFTGAAIAVVGEFQPA